MVMSILQERQPRCLSLWWDFSYLVWFQVVFLLSRDTLFFFLSSSLVWWCLLPFLSFPYKFPFLWEFWFFLNLVVLFLSSFVISCISLLTRLVGWVLWHINRCRLFNTKSIFIQIVQFQTIQFSISMQFKCQNSFILNNSVEHKYAV